MKTLYTIIASLAFAYTTLSAAEPALPAVPPALQPLHAVFHDGWYGTKGLCLHISSDAALTEEQWQAIEGLGLKTLIIGGKGINDDAIARIAKMELLRLDISKAAITDAACKSLAKMKALKTLEIGEMDKKFTGKDLTLLKNLSTLESCTLAGSGTYDVALEAISEVTQLKTFATWHTYQTKAGNLSLVKLVNLKNLTLGGNLLGWDRGLSNENSLDDSTLATVAKMTSLETIQLQLARFSLAGLKQLKALPHLKTLSFFMVDCTHSDIEKLRAEMPKVQIGSTDLSDKDRDWLINKELKSHETPPAKAGTFLIWDDFEKGTTFDLGKWAPSAAYGDSAINIQSEKVAHGKNAVHAHLSQKTGGFAWITETATFPALSDELWGRAYFYTTLSDKAGHTGFITVSSKDRTVLEIGGANGNFQLNYYPAPGAELPAGTRVKLPTNQWVCLEWHFSRSGPHLIEVYIDGKMVASYNYDNQKPPVPPFTALSVGMDDHGPNQPPGNDTYYDDFVIDAHRVSSHP